MKTPFLILNTYLTAILLSSNVYADVMNLNELWQVDEFSDPEAVIYAERTNSLYVSNINGKPAEKDGNGFISKVSMEGEIVEKNWSTGFNAPKGLAIHGTRLYVADVDELVEVSLDTGEILNRYTDSEAKFFNDAVAANDGSIYVADTKTNTIHQLKNGKFIRWLNSAELRGPNGLLLESERMLVTAWGTDEGSEAISGQVLGISMLDKSITIVGNEHTKGNLDGIKVNNNGDYFITDWMLGKLLLLPASGAVQTLLSLEQGTADLEYIQSKDILILPMMKSNKLIAYKVQ
ncbi:MAG: sugar lactone lactonase YvrE [Gammaproteobacteria bacterium]|jgi:sugar lactone lactonase YvrE